MSPVGGQLRVLVLAYSSLLEQREKALSSHKTHSNQTKASLDFVYKRKNRSDKKNPELVFSNSFEGSGGARSPSSQEGYLAEPCFLFKVSFDLQIPSRYVRRWQPGYYISIITGSSHFQFSWSWWFPCQGKFPLGNWFYSLPGIPVYSHFRLMAQKSVAFCRTETVIMRRLNYAGHSRHSIAGKDLHSTINVNIKASRHKNGLLFDSGRTMYRSASASDICSWPSSSHILRCITALAHHQSALTIKPHGW